MGEIKIIPISNGYVVFWNNVWTAFQNDPVYPAKATEDALKFVADILGKNSEGKKE
jgi:hypothetical protein